MPQVVEQHTHDTSSRNMQNHVSTQMQTRTTTVLADTATALETSVAEAMEVGTRINTMQARAHRRLSTADGSDGGGGAVGYDRTNSSGDSGDESLVAEGDGRGGTDIMREDLGKDHPGATSNGPGAIFNGGGDSGSDDDIELDTDARAITQITKASILNKGTSNGGSECSWELMRPAITSVAAELRESHQRLQVLQGNSISPIGDFENPDTMSQDRSPDVNTEVCSLEPYYCKV